MKSSCRLLVLFPLIIGIMSYSSFAQQGAKPESDLDGSKMASSRFAGDCPVTFYNPEGAPYPDESEYGFTGPLQLSMFACPIVVYRVRTGEWPDSWDDILEDYVPILPCYRATGKPYIFGSLDEHEGSAPADVIIADWSADGPDLYIACPDEDGFECVKMAKDSLGEIANFILTADENSRMHGGGIESPQYRLSQIMLSHTSGILSDFYCRHMRLPASVNEFFEGYMVNPDFDPGYAINGDDDIGTFRLLVNHLTKQSLYVSVTGPPRSVAKFPQQYGPFSEIKDRESSPGDLDVNEYVILLTEEIFFK
jgi:hypothetical protein